MSTTNISIVKGSTTAVTVGRVITRLAFAAFIPTPAGAPGGTYEHVQSPAAAEWIVNHNLGYRPNISVLTIGGVKVIAEVLHISNNQARVYFDTPMAGMAVCS